MRRAWRCLRPEQVCGSLAALPYSKHTGTLLLNPSSVSVADLYKEKTKPSPAQEDTHFRIAEYGFLKSGA